MTRLFEKVVLRLWTDQTAEAERIVRSMFELPSIQSHYLERGKDLTLDCTDGWQLAQWGMERAGNKDVQYALQANYAAQDART